MYPAVVVDIVVSDVERGSIGVRCAMHNFQVSQHVGLETSSRWYFRPDIEMRDIPLRSHLPLSIGVYDSLDVRNREFRLAVPCSFCRLRCSALVAA